MCPVKNYVNPEIVAAAAAVGVNVDPTDPNALAYVKEQFALLAAAAEKLAAVAADPGASPSQPLIRK